MRDVRTFVVVGLGLGDEGKGSIVDFLAKRTQAAAVIRHGGGPQAAHNVVQADGRKHCFAQLGSGMFTAQTQTHISRGMLIKPGNLLKEVDGLLRTGVSSVLPRMTLDPQAYLVTQCHQTLTRIKEAARGNKRYGSCGMGVGEAVLDRNSGENALQLADTLNPELFTIKLKRHWEEKLAAIHKTVQTKKLPDVRKTYDESMKELDFAGMLAFYLDFGAKYKHLFKSDEDFVDELPDGRTLILEGTQGILLDPAVGFAPHVTKTDSTFRAALKFLDYTGLKDSDVIRLGVLRAYATRHGAGPFVTCSREMSAAIPDLNNPTNAWQGEFRVGDFDLLTAKYGVAVSGGFDRLALTCLDQLAGREVRVCTTYQYTGAAHRSELEDYFILAGDEITALKPFEKLPPPQQKRRTELLLDCRPGQFKCFPSWPRPGSAAHPSKAALDFAAYLEAALGVKIGIMSWGPTAEDKTWQL